MKPNKSGLRKGSQEERELLCIRRVTRMDLQRAKGQTWEEIGKQYGISRQAACKFYKENKYLLRLKG